ncbi:hypothetical protein CO540_17455 [Micromonospora sp. WMMA2032]|uniref:TIGR04255 family protein n=1 Tax=Micromonospora sp. WMMA2032 TaxID=2039870 RepID=UPI000C059DB4|nr:TIGR04255 family protein [Micromonospora sp. WMMA2032]ATO15403.1 hypothetical protein CO540_17455 [Micromonospora sp. WMMA2032]
MAEPTILNFDNPPIAEVVAAVSYDALPSSALAHFGIFWKEHLAATFPRIEEKPPLVPPLERFGAEVFAPQLTLVTEPDYPSPRLWALNESGDELLQLQRNWFACNWRKVRSDSSYTHWPSRRAAFARWYSALEEYVRLSGLGSITPLQCELTYVNHILSGNTWKRHGEVSKIFRSIGESEIPVSLERESTRFGQDFLMLGDDSRPIGRLHASAQPAFRTEGREPIYVLELTARGVPANPDIDGILSFLDQGREAINAAFSALTADEMQLEWGRK